MATASPTSSSAPGRRSDTAAIPSPAQATSSSASPPASAAESDLCRPSTAATGSAMIGAQPISYGWKPQSLPRPATSTAMASTTSSSAPRSSRSDGSSGGDVQRPDLRRCSASQSGLRRRLRPVAPRRLPASIIHGDSGDGPWAVVVASAGDVNGDGFGDLIVGAPGVGSLAGDSYVVFGKASGFADIDASALLRREWLRDPWRCDLGPVRVQRGLPPAT